MRYFFSLLFFIFCIESSHSGLADIRYFNQQINKFKTLMNRDEKQNALQVLDDLHKRYPADKNLNSWYSFYYNTMGRDASTSNRYDQAIKHFRKALSHDGSDLNKAFLASAMVSNKDYFEAAVFMEKNLNSVASKLRQSFMKSIAHSYVQIENYRAAIYYLKEQVFDNPNDLAALTQLAQAYLKNQDNQSAIKVFEKIEKFRPLTDREKGLIHQATSNEMVKNKYRTAISSSFEIQLDDTQFEGYLDYILQTLDRAFMELGRIYEYYPEHKTRVKVLTDKDFNHVTGRTEGVVGLRTTVTNDLYIRFGKNIEATNLDELERILWHEYNHHLLMMKTKGLGQVPAWFIEGIAVYLEPGYDLSNHLRLLLKLRDKNLLFHSKALPQHMSHYGMYVMASSMIHLLNEKGHLAILLNNLTKLNYLHNFEQMFKDITRVSSLEFADEWNQFIRDYLSLNAEQK